MKFTHRTKVEVDVNLTPLIDVVFLLLIFFMVSTTFIKDSRLSIDLPQADGETSQVASNSIEIIISKTGQYAINDVALVNSSLRTLKAAIDRVSDGDSKMPMIITADAATPHQAVVRAMDAAGQLGFVHLSITTRGDIGEADDGDG
ncbi:MAG: biopolymer transporter ExbD [Gammaproteobacteria bacterium]|nr:biopolymer transporter ExbD [Gammaproteobacteria bacterium]